MKTIMVKNNPETSRCGRRTGLRRAFFSVVTVLLCCAVLFSCASAPSAGSAALPENPEVVRGTMTNGMQYMILQNREPENRIFLRLVVRAGSVLEEEDQLGVAHLIEHMAFNGTAHFRENELVDYFESIGMSFGPEVNAYTSADETVYMLEVPADDPEALQTAFLVFSDWASSIAFDPAELDKERGVVVEEWRLGRGASGRVQDAQIPLLYAGSRYAERLPIGDPEIVRTVPRERVVDFYRDWYRPDRMTAVVVGDCDPRETEKALIAALESVPAAEEGPPLPDYPIPVRTGTEVQVLLDPELSYVMFQLIGQSRPRPLYTEADFRADLVRRMLFSVFSARLNEALLSGDAPVIDVACGMSVHGRKAAYPYIGALPETGKFREAFSFVLEKTAQLQRWGVTEEEAARVRADFLASAEQTWLNRGKVSSSALVSPLLASALYGEPAVSLEDSVSLYRRLVPEITAQELSEAVRLYFPGKGSLLLVTGPESARDQIPSAEELESLWKQWSAPADLAPYAGDAPDRPLFDGVPLAPGSIVSRTVLSSAAEGDGLGDIELWTLSNGASVLVNPTPFKADEILFSAYSPGGLSLVDDSDYVSASVAAGYAQASGLNGFTAAELEKKLAGKSVAFSLSIDSAWESMSGRSSNADLETLFQLISLSFLAPEFSDAAWNLLSQSVSMEASQRLASPTEQLSDAIVKLRYGDNIRFRNLTPEMAASLDAETAARVYRERFADAGDFLFVFTGSIDGEALAGFVSAYLAGLPSSGGREQADVSRFPPFPEGVSTETVHAGMEEQATVFLSYGGRIPAGEGDFALFDSFCLLLDIRLRELVRERLGGTYGVSAYGGLSALPRSPDGSIREYSLSIQFGCAPDSWQMLTEAVQEELQTLSRELADAGDIGKLTETYRRTLESGQKNNAWIHSRILSHVRRGFPVSSLGSGDAAALVQDITAENMRSLAETYIRPDNYIRAVLVPAR